MTMKSKVVMLSAIIMITLRKKMMVEVRKKRSLAKAVV
jgi:hypothetical protein